jgi:hypothetical protein
LARLEIFDPAAQADIRDRARFLESERGGSAQTGRIVAWSLAAIVSIVLIVIYGTPLVAERLTPLIPLSFEQSGQIDLWRQDMQQCGGPGGVRQARRDLAPRQPSGNAAADRSHQFAHRQRFRFTGRQNLSPRRTVAESPKSR